MPSSTRRAVASLYVGLALTVIATVLVPIVVAYATNSYTNYIQNAYPDYSTAQVDNYRQTIAIYLVVNGVLGVLAWLWIARQARRQTRTAPFLAVVLFVLGVCWALFNLLVKDSTGYPALTTLMGVIGLVPAIAGLVAVVQLWRAPTTSRA
ncbi:hypothetical protein [Nocardia terpenica]|uniref:hypothetical protein n=1 Tax=Nocardia terpenica TaxID=455432 RepID=UPI0008348553|nr:hypothetical protein [Nocardia terpenica]NQE91540.1 hypothetical protein [Nocardia terpenica]